MQIQEAIHLAIRTAFTTARAIDPDARIDEQTLVELVIDSMQRTIPNFKPTDTEFSMMIKYGPDDIPYVEGANEWTRELLKTETTC